MGYAVGQLPLCGSIHTNYMLASANGGTATNYRVLALLLTLMLWAGYGYGGFGGNTASNGTYAISVSFDVSASPDGSATPYTVGGSRSNVDNELLMDWDPLVMGQFK